ncbi:hypothetical protein F511_28799 [Dorcoceras hygrometricum]|uniref:Secreted protein n=1 Tax=Dorcoceras hygrometricum TaxID=472368 RepID=A0A2Z7AUD7_9LAMI|nr:hypothetical protein F511_28799 [Dorcoceras hygrometricum]
MKICWFWFELKLLLVDIARSVRLSGEVTRVSQRFGMLTINFSRCVCEERSADGLRAADRYDDVGVTYYLLLISRRANTSVEKRRRFGVSGNQAGPSGSSVGRSPHP